jgi:hypothetical protein
MVHPLPEQLGAAARAVEQGGGPVQRDHRQPEHQGARGLGRVVAGHRLRQQQDGAGRGQHQAEQVAVAVEAFALVHAGHLKGIGFEWAAALLRRHDI